MDNKDLYNQLKAIEIAFKYQPSATWDGKIDNHRSRIWINIRKRKVKSKREHRILQMLVGQIKK